MQNRYLHDNGVICSVLIFILSLNGSLAWAEALPLEVIEETISVKASKTDAGVIRVTSPRKDVVLNVDNVRILPPAGLTSWAAFKPLSGEERLMILTGDTVVFEDEITPAMDAAFAHGLEVTALHNHFVFDRPPAYFMHIGGMDNPEKLAAGVDAIWKAIREVRNAHPQPQDSFPGSKPVAPGELSAEPLEEILGATAAVKDGIVKFSFGRTGKMHGVKVGASMGLNTWAAFSGGDELAAVDGDFIMSAEEVQPVMHSLREENIHIVALHNHMIGEKPAYYFLHFWAKGTPQELAKGVKAALEAQKSAGRKHAHPEKAVAPSEKTERPEEQ